MNTESTKLTVTGIELHSKSRILSITFNTGEQFDLSCEFLRVSSRAAEVRASNQVTTGKQQVNIDRIEPQGHYAIRICFDDGHDTSVYSWQTLYELGQNQKQLWAKYLEKSQQQGIQRENIEITEKRTVKLLYFVFLVNAFGKQTESLDLPTTVLTIDDLLKFLSKRGGDWARFMTTDQVQATVNKQFSEPYSVIGDGDEIAFVPLTPKPVDL